MAEPIGNGGNIDDNELFVRDVFNKSMAKIFIERKMKPMEYTELQLIIYNNCVEGLNHTVYSWVKPTENGELLTGVEELVDEFLNKYIKEEVLQSIPETDEDCLLYYTEKWKKYQSSTNILNNVCRYVNDQKLRGNIKGKSIEYMAIQIWHDHVYNSLNERVSMAALELFKRSRNGEIINTSAVTDVIQSYIQLGCLDKKTDSSNGSHVNSSRHLQNSARPKDSDQLTVYKLFEEKILSDTSEYYSKESELSMQKFLVEQKSFVEYMKHIAIRLNDEIKRTKMLHPSTEKPLMQLCSNILIENHLETFDAEFRTYLSAVQLDEMELMCSLAIQSDPVIKRLNSIFYDYILKEGQNEMEKCANEAFKDPRKYIQTMLTVYKKYDRIVCQQFKFEVGFKGALDKACNTFINENAVTRKANSMTFSAESLATYCNILLKKSNKNMTDAELEVALDEIMIIFRFIEDKDVFEMQYKRRLADRLVMEMSASDEAETSLISRMKQDSGYEYTNELEKMYQDVVVSKSLTDTFLQNIEKSDSPLKVDFRIKVLPQRSWPLTNDISVNLPIELIPAVDRFLAFYNSQHSGRNLMWIYKWSKAELIMNGLKKRYIIKANTLQTAVLLQYNEQAVYSTQELIKNTGIKEEYMMSLLESMIKMKLLKRSSNEQGTLCGTSNLEINTAYNEPKTRFDITGKLESERRAEQKQTLHRIDEDRRHLIEAAIVRIMKMRKQLRNSELIGEVFSQLHKFIPKVPQIKKCIEKLIDKEYLERDSTAIDTYKYLA